MWNNFWEIKKNQNEKLKFSVKNNVLERVKLYLEDENLNSQGYQADVNCKIEFNGFKLTPLLLAI